MNEITRIQNQDSWKRTQFRIPQDLYIAIVEYAKVNNLSLNSAMIYLIEKGMEKVEDVDIHTPTDKITLQLIKANAEIEALLDLKIERLTAERDALQKKLSQQNSQ